MMNIQTPTLRDVTRYRYHYGASMGSIFVLERWLTPSMFPSNATGKSELTAVEAWVRSEGVQKTRQRFERHWKEYVSDADLDWLRDEARCTTVRLPTGFFTLGPTYCAHTPFEKVSEVYRTAWTAVLALIRRCHERGIGVLIDLHAVPGGANDDIHSGTDSGKAEFWDSPASRELAVKCLCFVAREIKGLEGIAGIQVVNEAEYEAPGMYQWYEDVLGKLSKIDSSIPLYISDAWDLKKATKWSQQKNSFRVLNVNPLAIDTHCYWCFSAEDRRKDAQQIINEVPHALADVEDGNVFDHGAAQVVAGEYSCVLDNETWMKSTRLPREQYVSDFGRAQCRRFHQRAGGSFFWTYRMDWMPGGEWGFRQMTESEAISPPPLLKRSSDGICKHIQIAKSQRSHLKQIAVSDHTNYWDSNYPGRYEHWRFERGWDLGYDDAIAFCEMRCEHGWEGGDQIGMLDLWCLKRLRDGGEALAGGGFGWEFEQGIRQGIGNFYECVGL